MNQAMLAAPRRPVAFLLLLFLFSCSGKAFAAEEGRPPADPELAVMAGQMIMSGFRGLGDEPLGDSLSALLEDIGKGRVGGVILFDRDASTGNPSRNVASLEQVKKLAAMLQAAAPTPLFIGIDQEGGRVRRLKEEHGFPALASAEELGAGDPAVTRDTGKKTGAALLALGINLNFAPSLDVNVNPASPAIGALGRSFSANAEEVARHGLAYATGLFSSGVLPCYKHFPGHGSAKDDTHLGLADITATWGEDELIPYRQILPQSPPAMVMPGHIAHRSISGDMPASLSPQVIQGMLRRGLNWQGVVITDDLQMQAVEGRHSPEEIVLLAVTAGADILLYGNNLRHDPQEARKAHAILMQLTAEGKISKERVRQSYERIMRLKREAGIMRAD